MMAGQTELQHCKNGAIRRFLSIAFIVAIILTQRCLAEAAREPYAYEDFASFLDLPAPEDSEGILVPFDTKISISSVLSVFPSPASTIQYQEGHSYTLYVLKKQVLLYLFWDNDDTLKIQRVAVLLPRCEKDELLKAVSQQASPDDVARIDPNAVANVFLSSAFITEHFLSDGSLGRITYRKNIFDNYHSVSYEEISPEECTSILKYIAISLDVLS